MFGHNLDLNPSDSMYGTMKLVVPLTVFTVGSLFADGIALNRVRVVGDEGLPRQELIKHLKLICDNCPNDGGDFLIVLGESAPGDGSVADFTSYARRVGNAIYLWGDDKIGRHGTLFAVYGLCEKLLGVRWVYPGDDGIVFWAQESIEIPKDWSWVYRPPLAKSKMRGEGNGSFSRAKFLKWEKYLPLAMRGREELAKQTAMDNYIWGLRHRHQTREEFAFGHAFVDWNKRFYKTHPEYLALNVDDVRGSSAFRSRRSTNMKLCLSNEDVVDQIVRDWKEQGMPKYLNICPNDCKGYCRCERCKALDCPLSASEPFALHVSDRYVNFWNRIAKKVLSCRSDTQICTYAYESYREPPRRERLAFGENMILGVVLLPEDDFNACIEGWKKAGMKRFVLRPNSLCYRGVLPRGRERYLFDNIKTAIKNGAIGCDYDGSFRHVMDFESYAVARVISDPMIGFDTIEQEFFSQFGAAARLMKRYYDRVRMRNERVRKDRMLLPAEEKEVVCDEAQLCKGILEANPLSELTNDLVVLKCALATKGISALERRRVELRVLLAEHAIRTCVFLSARDTQCESVFLQTAVDLIQYRTDICDKMYDDWGRIFRGSPCEVKWWRAIKREIKEKYPEMELND